MTSTPVFAALAGFGLTTAFILFLLPRAARYGLVDHPHAERAEQGSYTPMIGGLAIVLGLALTALLARFADAVAPAFWAGLGLVALVGALDDRLDLRPRIKFGAQILAGLLMIYWGGLALHTLGALVSEDELLIGRYAVPLTLFAVIGVANAINLSDGADGLAGGLAFIALAAIVLMQGLSDRDANLSLSWALLGCIAAFLAFNLRTPWRGRASTFLGDAGSLALGYALAWLTVEAAQPRAQVFPPVIAIWLIAIPLSDTLVCMTRRVLKGRNPFQADRTHLHHILIDLGLPAGKAVACILGAALFLAALGVAGWAMQVHEHHMFYSAMGIFVFYIVLVELGLRSAAKRRHA